MSVSCCRWLHSPLCAWLFLRRRVWRWNPGHLLRIASQRGSGFCSPRTHSAISSFHFAEVRSWYSPRICLFFVQMAWVRNDASCASGPADREREREREREERSGFSLGHKKLLGGPTDFISDRQLLTNSRAVAQVKTIDWHIYVLG